MLTKAQILAARPAAVESVDAPEFGEGATIGVRMLSAGELLRLSKTHKDGDAEDTAYAKWFIATACDESGKPLFDDADIEQINALPFTLVRRVVNAAMKLNGVAEDQAKN